MLEKRKTISDFVITRGHHFLDGVLHIGKILALPQAEPGVVIGTLERGCALRLLIHAAKGRHFNRDRIWQR